MSSLTPARKSAESNLRYDRHLNDLPKHITDTSSSRHYHETESRLVINIILKIIWSKSKIHTKYSKEDCWFDLH